MLVLQPWGPLNSRALENSFFYLYACIDTHSMLPVKKKQDTEIEICYIYGKTDLGNYRICLLQSR